MPQTTAQRIPRSVGSPILEVANRLARARATVAVLGDAVLDDWKWGAPTGWAERRRCP
ncbi:hypothetical protein AB4305_12225 [Nocardia sp. 2YAB30]|uniref:hypothetical protein n=1 Tax=unclassified Nocardia TaxID=2637762 RepID=UPI003F9924F8